MKANSWIKTEVEKAINNNDGKLLESKVAAYMSEMGSGLFAWYPFESTANVLQLSGWFGVHGLCLCNKVKSWTIIEQDEEDYKITNQRVDEIANINLIKTEYISFLNQADSKYDYIILAIDEWNHLYEKVSEYEMLLSECKKALTDNGHVLFVVPNRLGTKYLCGTATAEGSAYDGITDDWARPVRMSLAQLKRMSNKLPYSNYRIYHPYFDTHYTQAIYAEQEPDKSIRDKISLFHEQQTRRLLDEAVFVDHLVDNGILNSFCNAFFVDYTDGRVCDVDYATISIERPHKNAMATIIRSNKSVEKRFVFSEGRDGIKNLIANHSRLSANGVNTLLLEETSQGIAMPYVKHKTVMQHIHDIADDATINDTTINDIYTLIDRFVIDMQRASELTEDINPKFLEYGDSKCWGAVRKEIYTEMIPNNCFYVDGEYLYFDQEFKIQNCPEVFLLYRIIRDIYHYIPNMNNIVPIETVKTRYNLTQSWNYCYEIEEAFQRKLRQYDKYKGFWHWIYPSMREMMRNRSLISMINYAKDEDIFDVESVADQNIVLFGTGKYAESFWKEYGLRVNVLHCMDNNANRWNESFHGFEIKSVDSIVNLPKDGYYIVIAVKAYKEILEQLQRLDVGLASIKIYKPT